jgi:hypothetical protein
MQSPSYILEITASRIISTVLLTPLRMQQLLYITDCTYMQELAEFSIANGPFLVFPKIQLYKASVHIKRNFVMKNCFFHHLRELI